MIKNDTICPVITGTILFFTPQSLYFYRKDLYFKIFSVFFLITFLSSESAISISTCVPFFIITYYNVQFIVRNDSVNFRLFIA